MYGALRYTLAQHRPDVLAEAEATLARQEQEEAAAEAAAAEVGGAHATASDGSDACAAGTQLARHQVKVSWSAMLSGAGHVQSGPVGEVERPIAALEGSTKLADGRSNGDGDYSDGTAQGTAAISSHDNGISAHSAGGFSFGFGF